MATSTDTGKPGLNQDADPTSLALEFLRRLLGAAPPDLHGYLWTLPGKVAHAYRLRELGNGFAVPDAEAVYLGCALSRTPIPPNERLKSEDAAGIVGLWA